MRVLFSSTRGTGHLQPLLPYAKALVAKGHDVLVACPPDLSAALLSAGLEHAPFGHPGDAGLAPHWARLRSVPPEQQPGVFVKEIFAGVCAQAAFPGLLETIRNWRPQLVVRDSVEFAALVAAEVVGVPHVRVAVHQRAMEEGICSLAAAPVDVLRQIAGLTPDAGLQLTTEPIFTSFPESFEGLTESGAMRPAYRVGPITEAPGAAGSSWTPSVDGLPLVYITFGTVATSTPESLQVYQTAVAAVSGLPVQALLTTGRGFDPRSLGPIPENLQVAAWVPQTEVLPHAALLVCHGGSGTVLGGLAAGIPQVVIPQGADQPFNAKSIAKSGAGLALNKPDAETLRTAILRVLADPTFRDAARVVAAEMSTLRSVEDAVEALVALASG